MQFFAAVVEYFMLIKLVAATCCATICGRCSTHVPRYVCDCVLQLETNYFIITYTHIHTYTDTLMLVQFVTLLNSSDSLDFFGPGKQQLRSSAPALLLTLLPPLFLLVTSLVSFDVQSRRAARCSKREITSVANFMFVAKFLFTKCTMRRYRVCVCVCLSECASVCLWVYVCTSHMYSEQARTVSLAAFALCSAVFTFAVIYLAANMF